MQLSEQGPITQVRLLLDGEGGTETININAEVAQLEAKVRAYEGILKVSTISSDDLRGHLTRAGYVTHDTME